MCTQAYHMVSQPAPEVPCAVVRNQMLQMETVPGHFWCIGPWVLDPLSRSQSLATPVAQPHTSCPHRMKVVGRGSFGEAVLIRGLTDGQKYVSKEVSLSSMSKREQQEAINEIRFLASLNHPNIIRYYESYQWENVLYIVYVLWSLPTGLPLPRGTMYGKDFLFSLFKLIKLRRVCTPDLAVGEQAPAVGKLILWDKTHFF